MFTTVLNFRFCFHIKRFCNTACRSENAERPWSLQQYVNEL